jgi:hypothetical protein
MIAVKEPSRSRIPVLLLGLAGTAILICLLLPLASKYRRFPYTGEWVTKNTRRDGRVVQHSLVFTKAGLCFQDLGDGPRMECSYVMQGSSAIVTHKLVNIPLNGKMLTFVVSNKATPARDGAVIYFEPYSGTMIDEATGKVVPWTPADEAWYTANRSRSEMIRRSEEG